VNVLVTGATGFLGQHVVQRLLERGHEVTATARHVRKANNFPSSSNVRFVVCDLEQIPGDPSGLFAHPDAVVHLAWPDLSDYASSRHVEKTLPAHCRFLRSLIQAGLGHVLVAGTCLEYGLKNGPLAESTPTEPVNSYALAKDTLRRFLELLKQQHLFILQWARLFYIYGPGQRSTSLLAHLDHAIDSNAATFDMTGGEQLRDFLPVEDIAARLVSLLDHGECQGCVNICSGRPISVRHLVEQHLARRGANIRLNLNCLPYSKYEPMAFWGDGTKFSRYCPDD
jgi:dTDP-6-deoxy-L-talose 4-dehydrogenase (NAD+)